MTALLIVLIALIVIWIIFIYNLFIRDKNLIKEAWSGIDVQLKRRHNLIPNLVESVKGYSQHEKNLLEEITRKRSEAVKVDNIKDIAPAESDLSGMLKNLIVIAENYPDLKANTNFLELQKQLIDIEDQLQFARRYYNGAVRNYNIRVESFPSNIIAGIFNYKQDAFFEISLATERKTPEVNLSKKFIYLFLTFSLFGSVNTSLAQYENLERIISFDSDITIEEDASMIVVDRIKVYSTGDKIKRGIFRDFPTKYEDEYGNNINITFEVLETLRDGNPESFHIENQINGIRVYLGKSNYFLPNGEYTYTIKYKTDQQIGYFDKFDELYWNVTGNGWDFLIENVTATVNLPRPISRDDVELYGYTGESGSRGSDFSYKVINGDKIIFKSTKLLYPKEGLTIVVQWPKGIVYEPSQSEKLAYFAKDNLQVVAGIIGIFILILFYTLVWVRVGKDPAKGLIIPLYEPPSALSAGAVRFISEMGYDNKVFTSVIVSLAVKGYLMIQEEEKDYTLLKGISSEPLTPDESVVLNKLGLADDKGRNTLELKQKNHSILQGAIKALKTSLKNSYEKNYFFTNRKYFFIGLAISLLILVFTIVGGSGEQVFILIWISIWSMGVSALLFAVFKAWKGALNKGRGRVTALGSAIFITLFSIPFIGGEILGFYFLSEVSSPLMIIVIGLVALVNIVFYNLLKAPTLLGRKIMDKIEGFKMYLGVAEKDQIYAMREPDKTHELFESYLPFALALGVENRWAEKFSDILSSIREESYNPVWYSGTSWSTLGASGFASSLSSSFSNSISSSSTAPGSSSGGGGGGSSGGGGGGGGGGGW